jgi:hypothetical protein
MNDAAVEKDFGGIGDAIEHAQRLFVLVIVIVTECLHPSLNLLPERQYSGQVARDIEHVPASATWQLEVTDVSEEGRKERFGCAGQSILDGVPSASVGSPQGLIMWVSENLRRTGFAGYIRQNPPGWVQCCHGIRWK